MDEHIRERSAQVLNAGAGLLTLASVVLLLPTLAGVAGAAQLFSSLLPRSSDFLRQEFLHAVATEVFSLSKEVKQLKADANQKSTDIENLREEVSSLGVAMDAQERSDVQGLESEKIKAEISDLTDLLKERGAPTTEMIAVLEPAFRAWTNADNPQKRGHIITAVRSAFFEDKFSTTRTHLFEILSNLHQFEIDYLANFSLRKRNLSDIHRSRVEQSHAKPEQVVERARWASDDYDSSLFEYARDRLVAAKLVEQDGPWLLVTPLARILLDFIGIAETKDAP